MPLLLSLLYAIVDVDNDLDDNAMDATEAIAE